MRGARNPVGIRRTLLATAVGALGLMAAAPQAFAVDHFMNVREVFTGTMGAPDAELVELQMYQPNQDLVEGNIIHVYNAAGTEIRTYTFPNPPGTDPGLPNDSNQSTILIGTAEAASFFGVTPDLVVAPGIPAGGGQVCYEDTDNATAGIIDCASWGTYGGITGDPFFSGTPFNVAGGIPDGQSMLRDLSGGTSPTLLDASDDTNDSAADFDAATPDPRNNAADVTDTTGIVDQSGGAISFAAPDGAVNRLEVARAGSGAGEVISFTDSAAPVNIGVGSCTRVRINKVRCPFPGVTSVAINLGDLDDKATLQNGVDATADAEEGKDRLTSRSGDTVLNGGLGNDTFDPGTGTDVLIGGPGSADVASYAPRSASEGVTVTADDVPNDGNGDDGAPGARDNVFSDVERIEGGAGDDDLEGSGFANRLTGGGGIDVLKGFAGNDEFFSRGDGAIDDLQCGAGIKDKVTADPTDTFSTTGPEACEIIN